MKQNKFSLVIDSAFRTKRLYPSPTKFQIPVNDIVTNEYLNSPLKGFSWKESSLEKVGTIVGGNQQTVILSKEFSRTFVNYYVGCLLVVYNSSSDLLESSYIVEYIPESNTAVLEYTLSTTISTDNIIKIVYPDSKTNPYIIQILGYDQKEIFEYNNIYLYNYTRRWIREIKAISELGLANLLKPIPVDDYSPSDIFEIRTSPYIVQYTIKNSFESMTRYNVLPGSYEYEIGSYVYIQPDIGGTRQVFQVKENNVLEIIEYGGPFTNFSSYPLFPGDGNLSEIEIRYLLTQSPQVFSTITSLQTSYVIDAGSDNIPDPKSHVLYFDKSDSVLGLIYSLVFYNYKVDKNYIILIDTLDDFIGGIPQDVSEYGFIERVVVECSMNVPNWSFPQNPVCATVQIDTLILPNLRVKNYHKLLSFFPYVIVRLYNTNAAQYSRFGNIISNNLNSSNAQFICVIGNLQNPEIIRFVEVTSSTTQQIKFDPTQNIYFEVILPDGNNLEFEDPTATELINLQLFKNILKPYIFTITDTVACLLSLTIDL